MSAPDDFRVAMRAAGCDYTGPLHPNGKLHRIRVEGDKTRNSWYVLHIGPPAAGVFGCWKRGTKETWCDRNGNLSQAEWDSVRHRWQEAERERERIEKERHAKARISAEWILKRAHPLTAHAYLAAKGVRSCGEVREYRGALALPLCDADGALHSLQFVGADGTKRFLSGGRVAGSFLTVTGKPDGPLVICEGYATGASIAEATGHAVVCAMNAGNLLAVSTALRAKWPEREIIIAADNDQWTESNPGITRAAESAKTIHARLASPQFRNITTMPTDFNDLHELEGIDAVKSQIDSAAIPIETDDELFQRLAIMPPAQYDRCRQAEADRTGIRVGTLDSEVVRRRPKDAAAASTQGTKVAFDDVEPWPEPVSGAELLSQIEAILKRFVVAPVSAITVAALFALHTFAFDLGDISPILFITGPTKRCGKSKFLAILSRLVFRPFAAASATPAGIYRVIELYHPTLCIDEVDAFMRGDEQLRGLVNSGHTRDAAFHLGCAPVGDKEFEPRRWSTWTPKIFSGIGRLADTIEDRAIIIQMARRTRNEPSERLRHGMRFDDICRKALRFVIDNADAIRNCNPVVPDALHDRAADNYTPLLILADLAGGDWSAKARRAVLALSGADAGENLGTSGQLLSDIRNAFASAGVAKLASKDLAERLAQNEERPWAEYGKHRRPISANQLANLLRGFGVSSRTVRLGDSTPRGYAIEDFADAFARYLSPEVPPEGNNATSLDSIDQTPDSHGPTSAACCTPGKTASTNRHRPSCTVSLESREEAMLL